MTLGLFTERVATVFLARCPGINFFFPFTSLRTLRTVDAFSPLLHVLSDFASS